MVKDKIELNVSDEKDDKGHSIFHGPNVLIRREYSKPDSNGNWFDGKWVLYNDEQYVIDFDMYLNDLCERHNFTINYN